MTLTLELPEDLERELAREAADLGLPLEQYALRILADARQRASGTPLTGPDLVEFWRRAGVIGSRPEIEDPVAYARALRERAQHRAA